MQIGLTGSFTANGIQHYPSADEIGREINPAPPNTSLTQQPELRVVINGISDEVQVTQPIIDEVARDIVIDPEVDSAANKAIYGKILNKQ